MSLRFEWAPAETTPSPEDVLALQGIFAGDEVPARINAVLEDAIAIYRDVARPRAVIAHISAGAFATVYSGEGWNARETPLETIFPEADRLALVAATIGGALSECVRGLFRKHELALGCMLDAVGSAAAEHLAELVASRYLSMAVRPPAADWRALTYSPGYCGWHVSGQRALFRFLEPEQIGITLNDRFLMQPLKSISGVLVVGRADIHRFRPTYPFCETCRDMPCRRRMASLVRR